MCPINSSVCLLELYFVAWNQNNLELISCPVPHKTSKRSVTAMHPPSPLWPRSSLLNAKLDHPEARLELWCSPLSLNVCLASQLHCEHWSACIIAPWDYSCPEVFTDFPLAVKVQIPGWLAETLLGYVSFLGLPQPSIPNRVALNNRSSFSWEKTGVRLEIRDQSVGRVVSSWGLRESVPSSLLASWWFAASLAYLGL